jgi:2-dehydro-3-deoxy-D-gluconate 5-dehydrogenase
MKNIPDSALDFQHHDWTGIPSEQLPDGSWRQMIWGERLTVCRLRLPRRLVTTPHSHPHEQMTIVERGPVLFTIGEAQRVVNTGEVLHFPPNTWHGATMLDQEVILIDIFSPVREDFLPEAAQRTLQSGPGNLFRLDNKVALVTGSSRGLGAGMALALAGAGADVALHASEEPPASTELAIASATGRRTELFTVDLEDAASAERLIADTVARLGRIDVLVNNAGIIRRQPASDHSDENWDSVIEVNLSSVFRLCRAAGRHMLERGGGGKIINIASMLSFQGGIHVPSYAAAKGGIAQLTKALANEWAAHGINVNAIAPGYMETDNTVALRNDAQRSGQILDRIPAGRWGTPSDLAGAVVFLASNASNYVHGHILAVDGGWLSR